MKIGVLYSQSLSRWGDARYQMLRQAGFNSVDFSIMDTDAVPYTLAGKKLETYLRHEKCLADEAGIEIFQMHGPWRYPPRDDTPQNRAERMEKMIRSLHMAKELSCRYWVIHPIMPFGTNDLESGYAAETREINLTFMSKLLKEAKELDITVCLENMPFSKFSMSQPMEILRFVREMDDERFKVCLDTGHVSKFSGSSPADALRLLGSEVRVLHVHDNNGQHDQHLMPYYGVTDWTDFGKALREVDFQGVFSFETAPPRSMPLPAAEAMYGAMAAIARAITGQ